ncbi:hypothetical protein ACSBR2_034060 [Camellia fascicularis]
MAIPAGPVIVSMGVLFFLSGLLVNLIQFSHFAWVQTERKFGGLGDLKYPLISDFTKSISKSYGVLILDQLVQIKHQKVVFLFLPSGFILNRVRLRW